MLNHKHNACKSKSKILLQILCIFGLVFSYSCSCRNPNKPDDYTPKTYMAEKTIGSALIVVKSDGSSITPANISFRDATVTSVTVDAGTTGIAADAFKYENGNLTMTAFDSVTSTTRQKVTATFSLAPADSRDTLNNPTETVEIEVVKATAIDVANNVKEMLNPKENTELQVQAQSHTFMFKLGTWDGKGFTVTMKDTDSDKETSGGDLTVGFLKGEIETKWQTKSPEYPKYCDGVEWTGAEGMETQTVSLKVKFKFKPEIEIDNPDQVYTMIFPMGGTGKWKNQLENN